MPVLVTRIERRIIFGRPGFFSTACTTGRWACGIRSPQRELLDGAPDPDSDTRGGLNFGGGLEYFVGERASVKGEARWDIVSQPAGFPDATGFTLTFGYKRYF